MATEVPITDPRMWFFGELIKSFKELNWAVNLFEDLPKVIKELINSEFVYLGRRGSTAASRAVIGALNGKRFSCLGKTFFLEIMENADDCRVHGWPFLWRTDPYADPEINGNF